MQDQSYDPGHRVGDQHDDQTDLLLDACNSSTLVNRVWVLEAMHDASYLLFHSTLGNSG